MATVEIRPYLSHFIERYLFGDLATMSRSGPAHAGPGHLGYSMVLSACGGIEFLGALTDAMPYKGQPHFQKWFTAFWTDHLYRSDRELAEPFFQLLRNGLAHTFQTKQRVLVTKFQPHHHLTVQRNDFVVDCTTLAEDLQRAYRESYLPQLDEDRAQKRLNERLEMWSKDVSRHWETLVTHARKADSRDLDTEVSAGGAMDRFPHFAPFGPFVMPSGELPAGWMSWLPSGEAVCRAGIASNSPACQPNMFIAPSRRLDSEDE